MKGENEYQRPVFRIEGSQPIPLQGRKMRLSHKAQRLSLGVRAHHRHEDAEERQWLGGLLPRLHRQDGDSVRMVRRPDFHRRPDHALHAARRIPSSRARGRLQQGAVATRRLSWLELRRDWRRPSWILVAGRRWQWACPARADRLRGNSRREGAAHDDRRRPQRHEGGREPDAHSARKSEGEVAQWSRAQSKRRHHKVSSLFFLNLKEQFCACFARSNLYSAKEKLEIVNFHAGAVFARHIRTARSAAMSKTSSSFFRIHRW